MQQLKHQQALLSRALKRKCVDFVVDQLREDFLVWADDKISSKSSENNGESEEEKSEQLKEQLDHFILFGETREVERVLDVLLEEDSFSSEEQSVLREWKENAFESMFEIRAIGKDSLELFDAVAEVKYEVFANTDESPDVVFSNVKPGTFLKTNLAPVQGAWFLSGRQGLYGREIEKHIFETVIRNNVSSGVYRNNPEKLKTAFRLQKEEYDRFVRFFGRDEVVCKGDEINEKLREFYNARARELGRIPDEKLLVHIDGDMVQEKDVGIVIDEKEGMHFFTDYGAFLHTFQNPDQKPRFWRDMIEGYLMEDSIPAFVFRRMKERHPNGFRTVMKEFFRRGMFKKPFDPVDDFERIMDIYKPGWREYIYPSTQPLNERFREYYS